MPERADILAGLTEIAVASIAVAVVWHAVLAALAVAFAWGRRPSNRAFGWLVAALPVSVSTLAALHASPFNAVVMGVTGAGLAAGAMRLSTESVRIASGWEAWLGTAMLCYAWVYPHFLEGHPPALYLVAAPVGVVPCPSLAAATGLALLARSLDARWWSIALASVGTFYALFGIFRLGVLLDVGLLVGALGVLVAASRVGVHGIERTAAP